MRGLPIIAVLRAVFLYQGKDFTSDWILDNPKLFALYDEVLASFEAVKSKY